MKGILIYIFRLFSSLCLCIETKAQTLVSSFNRKPFLISTQSIISFTKEYFSASMRFLRVNCAFCYVIQQVRRNLSVLRNVIIIYLHIVRHNMYYQEITFKHNTKSRRAASWCFSKEKSIHFARSNHFWIQNTSSIILNVYCDIHVAANRRTRCCILVAVFDFNVDAIAYD